MLVASISRNELNDVFLHYFDESVEFRRDADFTVENLTGLYTMEYSLAYGEPGAISEPAFLADVAAFAVWYEGEPETIHVSVITDTFRQLNKSMRGDDPAEYRLPVSRELAAQYLLLYEMSLPYGLDLNNQIDVDKSATRMAAGGYEAVAICLLNAYANPAHEQALADLVGRRLQHVVLTCSSDTAPEFRAYERASTTVIAAHVQPVISEYLERFERHLASRDFSGSFSLMQSNGGRLPSTGMRRNPVTALFSEPAAGVMSAVRQSVQSGFTSLITFDMGGTSTDVCLIQDGEPELTSQSSIDGLPVRTPLFDIVSVGAGCGSIVWRDDGGMLRVGPQSAGADPGPACYGRGGDLPTITDAHIIQGTIRPDAFLGGAMSIDEQASHQVFEDIARHFGLALPEMADSAIRVADANIVRAIQLVSTERGRDPRDYVLVAFGGAGPLHAARVAEDLDIATILVPPYAGVLSAYGLLASDYRLFETRTRRIVVDEKAPAVIRDTVGEMRGRIEERLRDMGLGNGDRRMHLTLEMRFVGQAFEVPVEIDPGALGELTAQGLLDAFIDAHHRMYRTHPVSTAGREAGPADPGVRRPVVR